MQTGTPLVEMKALWFSYGTSEPKHWVFRNANLSVAVGDIVCVLGESGSGKTTLLNLISGTVEADLGSVLAPRGLISYLFQEDQLLPFRTVWQNCLLAAELVNQLTEATLDDARRLISVMRLDQSRDQLPDSLSGGMRRRVALARQLLRPASLLLLDEPFSAQDRAMRWTLEDVAYSRCRAEPRAAVIVTHDLDTAVALADYVVVIDSNQVLGVHWVCPDNLRRLSPSERRASPRFAEYVGAVWHKVWEVSAGVRS